MRKTVGRTLWCKFGDAQRLLTNCIQELESIGYDIDNIDHSSFEIDYDTYCTIIITASKYDVGNIVSVVEELRKKGLPDEIIAIILKK